MSMYCVYNKGGESHSPLENKTIQLSMNWACDLNILKPRRFDMCHVWRAAAISGNEHWCMPLVFLMEICAQFK